MKNIIKVENTIINVKYIVSYTDYEIVTINKTYEVGLTIDEITRLIYPYLDEFGSVSMRIEGSDLIF